ncbi:hypothetical protein KIN20_009332 [Parelaphostrongylus tenuis]|uniref:Saposin B-type domain-containing protein n=1 Tax=Parelaphostrongylus tenuis TaxID=148309 RepID=A0AAD5MSE1_PARTN|nr:hypothetical protein KIN20_009332 [Parelaphostrongylus tenuis]
MLKHNKIGKEPVGQISVASVCDECQSWVHRFHEAAKDPKKLEELKMILRVLCHETSYVEECRMFVANLDEIIKKLDPYLNDTHKVCKAIHMCSNTRLDAFHRIGLLYARRALNEEEGVKDLVCDECQFAARELKVIVEDKDKQKEIRDFLSQNVCLHLGSYRGMCDELIDQFLPEVFQELDSLLADPRQACSDAGFCPKLALPRETTTAFVKTSIHPVYAFFKGAGTMQTPAGSVLMSCFECKILLKIFVTTLLADRNNIAASMKALICHHLIPSNYSAGCNDFLSLYLPTALYMTFKQLIPGEVCLKAKLCDSTSLSRIAQLKESETQSLSCVSCSSLQKLLQNCHGSTRSHRTAAFYYRRSKAIRLRSCRKFWKIVRSLREGCRTPSTYQMV